MCIYIYTCGGFSAATRAYNIRARVRPPAIFVLENPKCLCHLTRLKKRYHSLYKKGKKRKNNKLKALIDLFFIVSRKLSVYTAGWLRARESIVYLLHVYYYLFYVRENLFAYNVCRRGNIVARKTP